MTVPQGFVRRCRVPCPRSLARISAILPTGLHEASNLLTRFRRLISPEILRSHIFLLNQAIFFAIIALLARLEKGRMPDTKGLLVGDENADAHGVVFVIVWDNSNICSMSS